MQHIFKFFHQRNVEHDENTGERISNTLFLGFFSSEEKCKELIPNYIKQPGFKDYPDDFIIEKEEADVDDFNDIAGNFDSMVFYLYHEWYDGKYDNITDLGCYSTRELAEKAMENYRNKDPMFTEKPDDFLIDEFIIDKDVCWEDGFYTWEEIDQYDKENNIAQGEEYKKSLFDKE